MAKDQSYRDYIAKNWEFDAFQRLVENPVTSFEVAVSPRTKNAVLRVGYRLLKKGRGQEFLQVSMPKQQLQELLEALKEIEKLLPAKERPNH